MEHDGERSNNREVPYLLRRAGPVARGPAEVRQPLIDQDDDFQQMIIASSFGLLHRPPPLALALNPTAHVIRVLFGLPFYPLTVVQTLTQLGYEPTPPQRHYRYNLFGSSYFYSYPGLIGYAQAIVRESGWKALYRGWRSHAQAELTLSFSTVLVHLAVEGIFERFGANVFPEEEDTTSTRSVLVGELKQFLIRLISETIVTAITHPLYVMNMRTIAQQIGNEHLYDGPLDIEVSHQNGGLRGLYAGFVPALLCNAINVALYSALCILMKFGDRPIYNALLVFRFFGSVLANPLHVTATMMAVNNVGLAAGVPPRVPVFSNWLHCCRHLSSTGSLKRGLFLFLPRFPQPAYKEPPKTITY